MAISGRHCRCEPAADKMVCTDCVCSGAQRAPCRPAVLAASILWHKAAGFVIARRRGDKNGGILHEKAIPILLVVFLCLLVAFSAVCEYRQQHPVPEEMLVSFESHGKCWFKNAEGETLECEGTNYSGDMQVIDASIGGFSASYFSLTVPYSKRLEASLENAGPDSFISVGSDLGGWAVLGSGVQRTIFTDSGVETTGENMEYSIRFFSIEEFYLEVTGSGESHIRYVRKGGKLYLTAQDAAFTVEFKSFLEEGSMDSMDFSAGETCTIRIRDGGMEFVR